MQHSGKQYVVRRSAIRIPAIRASTAGFSTYRLGEFRRWDPVARIRTRKLNPDSSPTAAGVFSEFLVADGLAEPASEDEHTFNTLAFFKRDQGFGSIAPVAVPTLVRNGAATLVFGN